MVCDSAAHYKHNAVNVYDKSEQQQKLDKVRAGAYADKWEKALSNEWGRLAQGNDAGIVGTDNIQFIQRQDVPSDKRVTYVTFVLDYMSLKTKKYRVRITEGGDRLNTTSMPDHRLQICLKQNCSLTVPSLMRERELACYAPT